MQLHQLEFGQATANRLLQGSTYGYVMRTDSATHPILIHRASGIPVWKKLGNTVRGRRLQDLL